MYGKDRYYYETLKNFQNIVKEQMTKYPRIKEILTDIENKSPTTLNHSVNVALHTYEKLNNYKGRFNEDKVKNWTLAALLHDIGKLNTPTEILHGSNLSDEQFPIMMAHSMELENFKIKYDIEKLPQECYIAMRGHHISYEFVENDFVGAINSKKTWNKYTDLTKDMQEHFKGMDENDKFALEMISFYDNIEALRSNERTDKQAFEWNVIKKIVNECSTINEKNKYICLNPQFENFLKLDSYLKHFDDFQAEKMSDKIREMIGVKEYSHEHQTMDIQEQERE